MGRRTGVALPMRPAAIAFAALVPILSGAGSVRAQAAADSAAPDIEGSWGWVRTTELGTDRVLSPAGEGDAQLHLVADSGESRGRYAYRRDGEVVERGRYSVSYEDGVGNDFVLWQPAFGPFHRQQWLNVAGDTLRLRDATARGHVGVWVRNSADPH